MSRSAFSMTFISVSSFALLRLYRHSLRNLDCKAYAKKFAENRGAFQVVSHDNLELGQNLLIRDWLRAGR